MSQDFDRDGLIPLLENLHSDDDEEVLKAARALTAGMKASGKTWDDLIVHPDIESYEQEEEEADVDEEIEEEEYEETEDEDEEDTASASGDMDNDEALKVIDKMLKKFKISPQMKEELEGYKEDIADGEFEDTDRQYLRSLHARLSKLQ